MAMESVTLPTRLRPYQNFESLLAGNDSVRRIFELQASILPPEDQKTPRQNSTRQSNQIESSGPDSSKIKTEFDLDFSYESPSSNSSHIFNQLQVYRGAEPDDEDEEEQPLEEDLGIIRKMRLCNSQPMFHR